jgi:acetyl esterase/lipase
MKILPKPGGIIMYALKNKGKQNDMGNNQLNSLILMLFGFWFFFCVSATMAQNHEVIHLWPENVPGEEQPKAEPIYSDDTSGNTTRIAEVTDPTISVFKADPEKKNGCGVIVCPGGGYHILAIDKEGTEIARWLNKLGYTAFVLQYRVPEKQKGALQDLQRAIRLVRSRAESWNIHSDKLGVIGFSAGGSLAARASTRYTDQTYPPVDEKDSLSSRPSFSLLIYPAYLDKGKNNSLTPGLEVTADTPPMFLFSAANDKHANSALVMGSTLRDQKVPVELHIVPAGGHGYGLRPGNKAAETWPRLAEKWLLLWRRGEYNFLYK